MTSEEMPETSGRPGDTPDTKPKKVLRWARRKQLERDLEHVQQEMYKRNLELVQINKTLLLLQAIDKLVLSEQGEIKSLSTQLSTEVMKSGAYPFVAILGYPVPGNHLEMYGWACATELPSTDAVLLNNLEIKGSANLFDKQEPLELVDLTEMSDARLAHYSSTSPAQMRLLRHTLSLKAVCLIRLRSFKGLVGVMMVGFTQLPEALTASDSELFARLSDAVGIALDHKLLLEENERVVAELKKSNDRLRKLDQTKDDFISMASHQLRTPLTSIKGYVSMTLEGDAGKLNETQQKMLTQAFISAQRMVYLISDLLNVSRLKTGKFVIEPVESSLDKIIGEELEQLTETVKSRGLELTYHKPQHFPVLMLDETKIRQVIMNFVDNAIYYTPTGGHIQVNLVDNPQSIEFTVVDDGIGVPRHEQHHLFSKFYRAHNARSARPDGTGLGLFMAKKVIVAQGGAIVFKSAEGKGSTFGFTFPKAKLLPKPASAKAEQSAQ